MVDGILNKIIRNWRVSRSCRVLEVPEQGNHHERSDIDIGIHYDESEGFDVGQLNKVAR